MSRWETFALTAAAAPQGALDSARAYIALPIPDEGAAYLSVDGLPRDLMLPLIDLGSADDISDSQLNTIFDVAESVAASQRQPLVGEMPSQLGVNEAGELWVRPTIDGLGTIQARLDSELAQHQVSNATAMSDLLVAVGPAVNISDSYTLRPPQSFPFDRLAVVVGNDVYEFVFGSLSSSAMLASAQSTLAFDGDVLALPEPSDVASPDAVARQMDGTGTPFRIPLLVPEGVPTGDGRVFKPMSLDTRDLPLPLMWQLKTGDGHDGSVVVGRVDTIKRVDNGLGDAYGVLDAHGPYGREVERLIRGKFLRGVSADLDNFEAEAELPDEAPQLSGDGDGDGDAPVKPRSKKIVSANIEVSKARVMGVTVVAKPAFQECYIELIDSAEEEPLVADGTYTDVADPVEAAALTAAALIASHIPTEPPKSWFSNPQLTKPTALTVTDDGQVFGHIAAWHVDHIGLPFGTRPPRSKSGYAYFHTGVVRTADGDDVPVGQLTLAGGHASLELSAAAAVKHYDDTASAVADVHAGEDAFGIWVAGALRPGTTPEQVRVLRASAPSGDWRPINGRLEMVAVCQVNVPGFPVARARVASGFVTALVAAGAQGLAELQQATVDERIAQLEAQLAAGAAAEAKSATALSTEDTVRMLSARAAVAKHRVSAMLAVNAPGVTEFRMYSREKREEYAKEGVAMPGGRYPIRDVGDLRNAIKAYGRARKEDKAKVRRHIIKRARALDRADLIPESWMKVASVSARMQLGHQVPDADIIENAVALGLTAALRFRRPWDESRQPRDDVGRWRKVLFRLKEDLKDRTGTREAVEKIEQAEEAEIEGNYDEARRASEEVITMLDKLADDTTNEDDQKMLRLGGASLGEAIARLPMPQGQVATKLRFSDLPAELQDLIEDIVARAAAKMDNEQFQEVAGPLRSYMSGGDYFDSDEIQSHLNRIIRMLV